jgi:hypothetical protein
LEVLGIRHSRILLTVEIDHDGAKKMGLLRTLTNEQTLRGITGRMLLADWKQWAKKRPYWLQEGMEVTFDRFVDKKWKDFST